MSTIERPEFVVVSNDGTGHYNCDGTNDEVQIALALDDGPTHIKNTGAPYSIGATIMLDPYDIIEGGGGLRGGTDLQLDFDGVMFDTLNTQVNTGIVMRNFRLDGNKDARAAGTGIRWYGVYLGLMQNIHFNGFDDYGIYFEEETGGIDVKQCIINNIEMIDAGVTGAGWHMEEIEDCRIDNVDIGFNVDANNCIELVNGGNGCFFNNIHLWGDTLGPTTGLNISAAAIRSTWTGVYGGGNQLDHLITIAAGAWGHTFTGVSIENTTAAAIECVGIHNQFTGGFVHSANALSIDVQGHHNGFSNYLIRDSAGVGVTVSGDDNSFVGVRTFSGGAGGFSLTGNHNMLTGCASDEDNGVGILLTGADYTTLTGCKAYGSVTGHGLHLSAASYATIVGGHYMTNDAGGKHNIYFNGASVGCTLNGAFSTGAGDDNVHIDATADNGTIVGCVLIDTGAGVNIQDDSGGTWEPGVFADYNKLT